MREKIIKKVQNTLVIIGSLCYNKYLFRKAELENRFIDKPQ